MKYKVSVEKRMYATGTVVVTNAESEEHAVSTVRDMIDRGELQTTSVKWGDAEYEDSSFDTTGDVEEA